MVVDDGSTDGTATTAKTHGATVLRHDNAVGHAAARHAGARSVAADVVLFVDADVVVAENAIPRAMAAFESDPDLAAVFGSYDDSSRA